jgi:hypothetical protein
MKENENEKRITMLSVFVLLCSGFPAQMIRHRQDDCGGILI